MTAGDIKSISYTQKSYPKKSGVTVTAGRFGKLNTDDPKTVEQAGNAEVGVCFGILPKNVTGEAKGQATPSMLIYGNDDLEISVLEKGVMAFTTTNAVTYARGNRVKSGANGLPVLFVEGTDEFREVNGIVTSSKVVGDGTNTVDIEIVRGD